MLSLGLGITSPQFRPFSPSQLFRPGDHGVVLDPSSLGTMFQDAQGQLPVTGPGDPVGLVLDKSGNDNHLTAPSDAARPVYAVSESGDKLLQSDEVDDELSVTLPDLGTDVTIAYTTQSELRIDEGETVGAGEYTLPQVDLLNYLMIDRQLTKSEKIELIRYLSRSTEGVNYGAVIDDMILACMNAVDVFVYDTTKDSDGGAWRTGSLAKASSWYNETLNTATRGSRREFPAVAVIVAEASKVTIYDGDDPSLPMWMVFRQYGGYNYITLPTNITAGQGKLWVGSNTIGYGLTEVNFPADDAIRYAQGSQRVYSEFGGVAVRNSNVGNWNTVITGASGLVNWAVNDIAATVLPDAPIDPATGLPVPTIAVATDGGVSVVKDDGTVVDLTYTFSANNSAFDIDVDETGRISWGSRDVSSTGTYLFVETDIPLSDKTTAPDIIYTSKNIHGGDLRFNAWSGPYITAKTANAVGSGDLGLTHLAEKPDTPANGMVAYTTSTYNTGWMIGDIRGAFLSDTDDTDLFAADEKVVNGTFDTDKSGWTPNNLGLLSVDDQRIKVETGNSGSWNYGYQQVPVVPGQAYRFRASSVEGTAKKHRIVLGTGVTNGDIVMAGGPVGTAGDKSVDVVFTATTTSVYVALQNTDGVLGSYTFFDDISLVPAAADRSVNNKGLIVNGTVTRSTVATGAELVAYSGFSSSNYLEQPYNPDLDFGTGDFCVMGWVKFNGSSAETILRRQDVAESGARFGVDLSPTQKIRFFSGVTLVDGTTSIDTNTWVFFAAVRRSGVSSVYVNGASEASSASTDNVTNTSAILKVGLRAGGAVPLTNGSLALLRISATAPTAEQIAKIYEDEKVLFQENAACTLYGTSDAVTALAHDPDTDLLHVGTSDGRSVFRGLERIQNTTTSVSKAISASGGLVAEK